MSKFFSEPKSFGGGVKVELYLSNTKINEIEKKITDDHDKYITTQKFNKLTSENFASRLAQANLASKSDFAAFVKKNRFWS